MLVGRVFRIPKPLGNIRWGGECEAARVWGQATTKAEAIEDIGHLITAKADKPGFVATARELGPDPAGGVAVWVESNDPATLVALVLGEQRREHGLSLADVAKKLGTASRNAYASYEQGQREPSIGKLLELLAAVAPTMTLVFAHREYLGGLSRGLEDRWKRRKRKREKIAKRGLKAKAKRPALRAA